ncbi:hypothetical protein CLMAG_53710 [Clostridium magnum DSM 2767]|uniref:Uncharacterized protein n=1 Tax=Clostridium magnum DSM 2767 TaxID=1121326 RepID=A0A162QYH2_9CLOT|nr:hypothetical protein CLMAG_53710 [Clostridium magnum DSM 2767]
MLNSSTVKTLATNLSLLGLSMYLQGLLLITCSFTALLKAELITPYKDCNVVPLSFFLFAVKIIFSI